MRVILTTDMADKRHYWSAGSEVDLPQKQAVELIRTNQAIPVREQRVERTSARGRRKQTTSGPSRSEQ